MYDDFVGHPEKGHPADLEMLPGQCRDPLSRRRTSQTDWQFTEKSISRAPPEQNSDFGSGPRHWTFFQSHARSQPNRLYFLFRVNSNTILTTKEGGSTPLIQLARCGQTWHGAGTLFTKQRIAACEIHILWEADQAEPWCLVTNLPGLTGSEYALRVWQEESFRDLKSGGWQ